MNRMSSRKPYVVIISLIIAMSILLGCGSTPSTTPSEPATVETTQFLTYEVLSSYIDEDTFEEVIEDEVVTISFPVGYVQLQNTDTVSGTFTVEFTFYSLDKDTAKRFEEAVGKIDGNITKMYGDTYSAAVFLPLAPDEIGTARYRATDISMEEDEWFWEFDVKPSTKTVIVEQE